MVKITSAFLFSAILFIGSAAQAADESRYNAWQGNDPAMDVLVERLNGLIGDAERARAADPNFLIDLRDAIAARGGTARAELVPSENVSSVRQSAPAPQEAAPQ